MAAEGIHAVALSGDPREGQNDVGDKQRKGNEEGSKRGGIQK